MTHQTPLSLLKAQLNIMPDSVLDDELLAHKLRVAEAWIATHTGEPFDSDEPAQVEAALMLAAYWFEQREAASFGTSTALVPFGVYELLAPFRVAVTGHQQ